MYRQVDEQDVEYYYLGNKLVSKKKGSTINYLHADYLGSTAAESNASGTVTDRMHYQPFGESIETPKDDVGYTGHKFDTDLGLSYMQARYYDPVIGRFYSNDPVGVRDVHSFNRYAYVNNNPYKYTDPTGKIAVAIAGPGASAIPIAGQNDITGQGARNKVIAKGVDGFIDDVIQRMEDIIGNNDEEILDIIRCKKDECIEEEVEKGGRICPASVIPPFLMEFKSRRFSLC
ncbi:RHS repeat domain-containing protein [Pseudocolwellia sp. HL-MZ19]|uniref:RHS repeat domain-containing protein n=1 Tax=Pseudocolwellia sp. HL-MZ19 TaxID=3400846 RepID=UPI003CFA58C2